MIVDLEMRWKYGRANKGSPEVPKKLQFRVKRRTRVVDSEDYHYDEDKWDDWHDVPKQP